MEGIITLVIIIIAFNIINAVLRALGGNRQTSQKRVFPGSEAAPSEGPEYRWAEDEPGLVSPGTRTTAPDFDQDRPPVREAEDVETDAWKAPPPAETRLSVPSAASLNLHRVLTRKGPLVAAFIFHEILERPPSLRRKR